MSARVVTEARRWIGTPYVHQASVCGAGTDCLGLLRGIWRSVHGAEPVAIPPYTRDWSEAEGREDLIEAGKRWLLPCGPDLAEGDVLVFRMRPRAVAKHLGIVSAVGPRAAFIHAYTGHGVIESPLSQPWLRRIAARYVFPMSE